MTAAPDDTGADETRYPALFAPGRWEWGGFDVQFSTAVPPDELVTNIHLVGFVGERVVVCRDRPEHWFLPGGTREPGESIDECVSRELREEAGARLVGPLYHLGAHDCVTDRPAPYRAHQPHPRKAWLWCSADVVVDAEPTNPADGEQVTEVRAVDLATARRLLRDEPFLPDLVTLAGDLRSRRAG